MNAIEFTARLKEIQKAIEGGITYLIDLIHQRIRLDAKRFFALLEELDGSKKDCTVSPFVGDTYEVYFNLYGWKVWTVVAEGAIEITKVYTLKGMSVTDEGSGE